MFKSYYVYIVSNPRRTVYYTGVTSNLSARAHEHKSKTGSLFTIKYNCSDLVYYEIYDNINDAIKREKLIKRWKRAWKLELILSMNPENNDLYDEVGYLD